MAHNSAPWLLNWLGLYMSPEKRENSKIPLNHWDSHFHIFCGYYMFDDMWREVLCCRMPSFIHYMQSLNTTSVIFPGNQKLHWAIAQLSTWNCTKYPLLVQHTRKVISSWAISWEDLVWWWFQFLAYGAQVLPWYCGHTFTSSQDHSQHVSPWNLVMNISGKSWKIMARAEMILCADQWDSIITLSHVCVGSLWVCCFLFPSNNLLQRKSMEIPKWQ